MSTGAGATTPAPAVRREVPNEVQAIVIADGYTFRNGTKRDPNTGREVDVFTNKNRAMLALIFVDGSYDSYVELSWSEVALIADYA